MNVRTSQMAVLNPQLSERPCSKELGPLSRQTPLLGCKRQIHSLFQLLSISNLPMTKASICILYLHLSWCDSLWC